MKKIILLIIVLTSSFAFSQELKRNDTDEFTGRSIKETSWEVLANKIPHTYVRFRLIDSVKVIDFKIMIGGVFSIREGENILLKLENNEILKFKVSEYTISGRGDGAVKTYGSDAQGVKISCYLSEENYRKIKTNVISKIRVNTSEGYTECDIKEKKYNKVKELIELI